MSLPLLHRPPPAASLFNLSSAQRAFSTATTTRCTSPFRLGPSSSNSSAAPRTSCLNASRTRYVNQQRSPFHSRIQHHAQRRSRYHTPSPITHARLQRQYHSASQPLPSAVPEQFSREQISILSRALSDYVPTYGFTLKSLTLGARDAGYLDVSLQLFTRGGEIELVLYWLASRREKLKEVVREGQISFQAADDTRVGLSTDDKVRTLVMERLRMNEGIIQHWQDALAVMSLPPNLSSSLYELYALSSDILYLAGDSSVNASWYTRRLSVATVYASAEITMTEDTSDNFNATAEFVQRRITDTNDVSSAAGDVKIYMDYVASSVVGAGRSWGMKI